MKKIFLSLILLFLAFAGFSQVLKPVKIDSLVTVSMPNNYQQKDTLNQQIFTANALYGYTVAIRQANAKNNTALKKEGDLNKVLKDMEKSIQAQSPGSAAIYTRDTTVGTLKARAFTLKSAGDGEGDDIQYRNFVLLYTQDATYTFEYVYPENRKDMVAGEYKNFMGSIRLSSGLQRNDQYLMPGGTGLSSAAKIGIYGGGALILIVLVTLVVKRRNKIAIG